MEVSYNGDTPKSSLFMIWREKNHPAIGVPPLTPINISDQSRSGFLGMVESSNGEESSDFLGLRNSKQLACVLLKYVDIFKFAWNPGGLYLFFQNVSMRVFIWVKRPRFGGSTVQPAKNFEGVYQVIGLLGKIHRKP